MLLGTVLYCVVVCQVCWCAGVCWCASVLLARQSGNPGLLLYGTVALLLVEAKDTVLYVAGWLARLAFQLLDIVL